MICGRCYATRADVIAHFGSICYMAGVIAICGRCCYHLFWLYCIWLMLLPYVYGRCYANRADVIAHLGSICSMAGVIAINCGRCCCHLFWLYWMCWCYCHMCVADVIATRLMLLPMIFVFFGWCYCHKSGRCYNHCLNVLADGIAKWQMEWPL